MTRELHAVRRAAQRRTASDSGYRGAILAARKAGASVPAIARAAGVSKQAVAQLLRRHREEQT